MIFTPWAWVSAQRSAALKPCPSARPGVQTEGRLRGEPAARNALARRGSWAEADPKCARGSAPSDQSRASDHGSGRFAFLFARAGAQARRAPDDDTSPRGRDRAATAWATKEPRA